MSEFPVPTRFDMMDAFERATNRMLEVLCVREDIVDVAEIENCLSERRSLLARLAQFDAELTVGERERLVQIKQLDDKMQDQLKSRFEKAQAKVMNVQQMKRAQHMYRNDYAYGSAFIDRTE